MNTTSDYSVQANLQSKLSQACLNQKIIDRL
jgi:hypothetical protein